MAVVNGGGGSPPQSKPGPNIVGGCLAAILVICITFGSFAYLTGQMKGPAVFSAFDFSYLEEKVGLYVLGALFLALVTLIIAYFVGNKLAGTEEEPGLAMKLFDYFWKPPKGAPRTVCTASPGEMLFHHQNPSKIATVDFKTKWLVIPSIIGVVFIASLVTLSFSFPLNVLATTLVVIVTALGADITYWSWEWDRRTMVVNVFTKKTRVTSVRKTLRGLMVIIAPLIYFAIFVFLTIWKPFIFSPLEFLLVVAAVRSKRVRRLLLRLVPRGGKGLVINDDTAHETVHDVVVTDDPEDAAKQLGRSLQEMYRTGLFVEFFSALWSEKYGTGAILILLLGGPGSTLLPWFDNAVVLRDAIDAAKGDYEKLKPYEKQGAQGLPQALAGTQVPVQNQNIQLPPGRIYDLFTGEVLSVLTPPAAATSQTVNVASRLEYEGPEETIDQPPGNPGTRPTQPRRSSLPPVP